MFLLSYSSSVPVPQTLPPDRPPSISLLRDTFSSSAPLQTTEPPKPWEPKPEDGGASVFLGLSFPMGNGVLTSFSILLCETYKETSCDRSWDFRASLSFTIIISMEFFPADDNLGQDRLPMLRNSVLNPGLTPDWREGSRRWSNPIFFANSDFGQGLEIIGEVVSETPYDILRP